MNTKKRKSKDVVTQDATIVMHIKGDGGVLMVEKDKQEDKRCHIQPFSGACESLCAFPKVNSKKKKQIMLLPNKRLLSCLLKRTMMY